MPTIHPELPFQAQPPRCFICIVDEIRLAECRDTRPKVMAALQKRHLYQMQSASSFFSNVSERGETPNAARGIGERLSSDRREPEVLAGGSEKETVPWRREEKSHGSAPVAERVRAVLATKGLTLYRVSRESAKLYGRSSPYFIPHNLYYDLRGEWFRPRVYLSAQRTEPRLGLPSAGLASDFGIDLEDIMRLAVSLPLKRTILVDTSAIDESEWVRWFQSRELREPIPPITPLARLLESRLPEKISSRVGKTVRNTCAPRRRRTASFHSMIESPERPTSRILRGLFSRFQMSLSVKVGT